jgi:hypothetical protein
VHVIAYRARDADAARWTHSLKSRRYIDRVAMQVCPIDYGVADVDPDAKSHCAVRRGLAIKIWDLTLDLHCALHRAVDTVEYHKQRVAPSLDNTASVFLNRGINNLIPKPAQPLQRPYVVQSDQAAVADHVGIKHGD